VCQEYIITKAGFSKISVGFWQKDGSVKYTLSNLIIMGLFGKNIERAYSG